MRLGVVVAGTVAFGLHASAAAAWLPLYSPEAVVDAPEVRAVVAHQGPHSTLWVQLVVEISDGRLVLVVPLADSAALDEGEPAWFSAVESATAPRVLPPADARLPECGAAAMVEHTNGEPRAELAELEAAHVLSDRAALAEFMETEGLSGPDALPQHPGAFVALSYRGAEGAPLSVALRLDAEEPLEKLLSRLAPLGHWGPTPLTLTIVGEQPVLLEGAHTLEPEDIGATWFADLGKSDYLEERRAVLEQRPGEVWVTETLGTTALFETYFPDAQSEVPPIFSDFQRRLEARGYECPDWAALLSRARADHATVAPACAEGLLARAGSASCTEPNGLGPALACEGIADLWFLLSGMSLTDVVLVRHVGFLPSEATLVPRDASSIEHRTVKVYADAFELGDCEPAPMPDFTGSTGFDGFLPAGTGGAPGQAPTDPHRPREPDPQDHVAVVVHTESCSCGSSSSSDGCSGDSSSSGSDESCSGDSSSTTGSDETCAGDSSSNSDPAGETCSSEGTADVEGETCAGSSSGSGGECALSAHGIPRPRLSVAVLLLAAGLLPWRRYSGRRCRRRPAGG